MDTTCWRPGMARLRRLRRDMQIIFQDPFGSLDPRLRVEDVIAEPLIIHESLSSEARRTRVAELLRAVGMDESAGRRYPARVQRRSAPAHRHRSRAGAAAEVYRGRRASFGARRERGRADREPARAAAARVRTHLPVHFALDAGGALSRHANCRHVPRPHCRNWARPRR